MLHTPLETLPSILPDVLPDILPRPAPKVGFVSLGCPKALTDSELILTQLSAEAPAQVAFR